MGVSETRGAFWGPYPFFGFWVSYTGVSDTRGAFLGSL